MDGVILEANLEYANITGHSIKEICQLKYQNISTEGSEINFSQLLLILNDSGKLGPIHDQYIHKNGNLIDVSTSASIVESDGDNYICWFAEKSEVNKYLGSNYLNGEKKHIFDAAQAKSIFNSAVDAIITINSLGIIYAVNPAAENMFGYSGQELMGNNISILLPEPYRSQHNHYIENYLNTGKAKIVGIGRETIALRKNGTQFNIHLTISETHIDEMILFTGIVRDISDLIKAQADQKVSEERFRRSQRVANIGTWDWNLNTGELYWSDRVPIIYGYKTEKPITTYEKFLNSVHPDDLQYVIDSINECVYHGEKLDIEHRCVWPDGSVRWISQRGDVIMDNNSKPSHMLGVVQDITLRKKAEFALLESEERFRGAFEYAAHGMVLASIDGYCLKVNKALGEIVGFNEQELLSANILALIYPEDTEKILSSITQIIDNKLNFIQQEARFVNKNQKILWVIFSASLVRDSSSQPVYFVCQIINISRRKQVERELHIAKEQAEKANQAKSEFLSSMSHELRTPLNSIIGFTELLQYGENLDNQQKRDLGEIKKAGYHLLELINDVLDLSKIESRQLKLTMDSINLTEQVNQCCSLIHNLAIAKNVMVINKLPTMDNLGLFVHADKVRMKQIILNLLSNAVKYNRDGGFIIISCEFSDNQQRIRLNISDTGNGIGPDKLDKLFTPFNRLGAQNSNIEGSGIGLVITKHLIEKMQGNIGVNSTEGKGTTFWIEFVKTVIINNPDQNITIQQSVPNYPEVQIISSNAKPSVLVIEDNPSNQILIASQLRHLGLTADIASTGQEAIGLWSKNRYDIVLTDINLPDTNGVDLVKQLKLLSTGNHKKTPFIAITASALSGDKENILNSGIDDYISKPAELEKLNTLLNKWIHLDKIKVETTNNNVETELSLKPQISPDILNFAALSRYLGEDPEIRKRFLDGFLQKTPFALERLDKACSEKNRKTIFLESHNLKSTAKTIGAEKMGNICAKLEQYYSDLDWSEINEMIACLKCLFDETCSHIHALNQ